MYLSQDLTQEIFPFLGDEMTKHLRDRSSSRIVGDIRAVLSQGRCVPPLGTANSITCARPVIQPIQWFLNFSRTTHSRGAAARGGVITPDRCGFGSAWRENRPWRGLETLRRSERADPDELMSLNPSLV